MPPPPGQPSFRLRSHPASGHVAGRQTRTPPARVRLLVLVRREPGTLRSPSRRGSLRGRRCRSRCSPWRWNQCSHLGCPIQGWRGRPRPAARTRSASSSRNHDGPNGGDWTRTSDLWTMKPASYQLLHSATCDVVVEASRQAHRHGGRHGPRRPASTTTYSALPGDPYFGLSLLTPTSRACSRTLSAVLDGHGTCSD